MENKLYELLRPPPPPPSPNMVGNPSIIFCQYTETEKSQICHHQYHDAETCASVIGFHGSFLYLYCSGQEMSCDKEQYFEVERLGDPKVIRELCDQVMKGALFGFLQVDTHVPDRLKERFSEFCPLFVLDTVLEEMIPRHMKEYQERTGRKTIPGTQKPLGVLSVKEIMLYMPLLQWYLSHGLKVTAICKYLG